MKSIPDFDEALAATLAQYDAALRILAGAPVESVLAEPAVSVPDPVSVEAAGERVGTIMFLHIPEVLTLHEATIERHSPQEPRGIRDAGLLESAVLNPQQTWDGEYLYGSLAEMAAAYLLSLALNHPFEQGNKRVALLAAAVFLCRNGYRLTLSQQEATRLTLGVAAGEIEREEAVAVIKQSLALAIQE